MATSNDQNRHEARHLEFEPNRQSRSGQSDQDNSSSSSSSGSYYGSKHGVQATGQGADNQREQSSGNSWISRGNNRTWVGASLGVLAAGAFVALTRDKWSSWGSSLSNLADKSGLTGSRSGQGEEEQGSSNQRRGSQQSTASAKGSSSQKSASSQKGSQADASLNREAASGIKSSPSSSKSFTDEGATGNND
ncbi:hypothetical protein [Solirubrum puertoriconensis]|uniref:Uncharacterized protein n=1 Tax=Solirubrum puertoriconensis TaxID=1751427 RepID=A0A9X0L563_SOLP1|nr:hypothetical protein [Solirubrum puertoriconensis]KUG08327.1 hypothetical protein ASU33_09135 [Solirubrum puertoriconensis]